MFWNKRLKELEDKVDRMERILKYSIEGKITGRCTSCPVIGIYALEADYNYTTYFYKSNQEYIIEGLRLYEDIIMEEDDSDDMIIHVLTGSGSTVHNYIVDLKTCTYIEVK